MNKIRFYYSTSFSTLLEKWIDNISKATPSINPFKKETIIVHSYAMSQHLTFSLARKKKIAANLNFKFPETFEKDIRENFFNKSKNKTHQSKNSYEPSLLTWCIFEIFTKDCFKKAILNLPYLESYLLNSDFLKKYQLASHMARIFNRYLFYREEMLWDWETTPVETSPPDVRWQKWLWQTIRQEIPSLHRNEEINQFKELFKQSINSENYQIQEQNKIIPDKITLFGISFLPNSFLELINVLQKKIPIDFYQLDTVGYSHSISLPIFFDNLGELAIHYWEKIYKFSWEKEFLENSKFLKPLKNQENQENLKNNNKKIDLKLLPMIHSLLHSSAVSDAEKNSKINPLNNLEIVSADIEIHSCPNQRREIEVVKNRLLTLFEEKEILADDVLVLAPNINKYIPYIQSVFEQGPLIPYELVDRKIMSENIIVQNIFFLLNLFQSQFEISKIKSLLKSPLIKKTQSWENEKILLFESWFDHLGVHWGKEANQVHSELDKYGWGQALRQLMISYAITPVLNNQQGNVDTYFENYKIDRKLYGEEAKSIGEVVSFLNHLLEMDKEFNTTTHLTGWVDRIFLLLKEFLFDSEQNYLYNQEEEQANYSLEKILRTLREEFCQVGGKDIEIDLNTFIEILKEQFSFNHQKSFKAGGISFASLLPMRTIPFKVVILMGMSHEAYPQHDDYSSLDITQIRPQPNDRTKKQDDQLIFLETILSCEEHLLITYSPTNPQVPTSPTVLVDKLIYLLASLTHKTLEALKLSLCFEHPSYSFDIDSFKVNKTNTSNNLNKQNYKQNIYRNYNQEDFESMKIIEKKKVDPSLSIKPNNTQVKQSAEMGLKILERLKNASKTNPLAKTGKPITGNPLSSLPSLPNNQTEENQLDLMKLKKFFHHPLMNFAKQQLSLDFSIIEPMDSDQEPIQLNGLEKYSVMEKKIEEIISTKDLWSKTFTLDKINVEKKIPSGSPGENIRRSLNRTLFIFHKNLQSFKQIVKWDEKPLTEIDFTISLPLNPLLIQSFIKKNDKQKQYNFFEIKLNCHIDKLNLPHRFFYRYLKITFKDILSVWIDHLALSVFQSSNSDSLNLNKNQSLIKSWLIAEDTITFFKPIDPTLARYHLEEFYNLYLFGQSQPLPLYLEGMNEFNLLQSVKLDQENSEEIDKKIFSKLNASWTKLDNPYVKFFIKKNPWEDSWENNNHNFFHLFKKITQPIFQYYHNYNEATK